MPGPKPKTKSQRQMELDAKHGKNTYRILVYTGRNDPITVKHSCGQVSTFKWAATLFQDKVCCRCENTHNFHRTAESYTREIAKVKPGFVCLSYGGTNQAICRYKHLKCGHVFEQGFNSFNLSKHCPNCAGRFAQKINTTSLAAFRCLLDQKFGKDEYKVIGDYKGMTFDARFRHRCGFSFVLKPGELLRYKSVYCKGCMKGVAYGKAKAVCIDRKVFMVQGHEDHVLRRLVKHHSVDDILNGADIPRFNYTFNKRECRYHPDFYLPKKRVVIEVKSKATMGLLLDSHQPFGKSKTLFDRLCAKAKAVEAKGYKFRLYLMDRGHRIALPKDWYNMNRKVIVAALHANTMEIAR